MHMPCMKNLHFQNKIFFLYISTPWTISEKKIALFESHVSLWVTNVLGFHHRRRTLLQTSTAGCMCLTKDTGFSPNFKPYDSRTSSPFRAHDLNTKHDFLSCHALRPVSRDVPVHMQCRMPLLVLSCYMHDESYMQHL